MADDVVPLRKAVGFSDESVGWTAPLMSYGMRFSDYGSYGLRQFSGWVREEYLPELVGREGARAYREMLDMSSTVGAMMFAIIQSMRKVEWRIDPPSDKADAKAECEFVDSLRQDMSHTWEDFVAEALSMLGYGYSVHELVYKKRLGEQPEVRYKFLATGEAPQPDPLPSSKFDDGRIGWRRLPIRGQDTVLKWFFDPNGQVRGVTQQPWVGTLIDLPIEKLLLFRPTAHKNNPEGRSILRNAYRSHYFVKRLEELEAILIERMGGFPVIYVPNALMEQAAGSGPTAAQAKAALDVYKAIVTGVRVNEQMGALLPSDPYRNADGTISAHKQYEFKLETPQHGRQNANTNEIISRHKIDMMMTLLSDFLHMGHEVRGTNNLAVTKVDIFYGAVEAWLDSVASVINNYALPRLWEMNALPRETMPFMKPDLPRRLDLDGLGNFIKNIALSGMPLFPDEELESFIRDAAGMPLLEDEEGNKATPVPLQQMTPPGGDNAPEGGDFGKRMLSSDDVQKAIRGAVARTIKQMRKAA